MARLVCVVAAFVLSGTSAVAQSADADIPIPPAKRTLLLICGLPGDDDHERQFSDVSRELLHTLTQHYDFAAENTYVCAGSQGLLQVAPEAAHASIATREGVLASLATLATEVAPRDELWVIVIGHASQRQQQVLLHLPGPDITAAELGEACQALPARQQLFVMTTAISGHFIRPLAKSGRIVISATGVDAEANETDYPPALARTLKKFSESPSEAASPGPTVLDLHNAVARDVLAGYLARGHLATEHALLDDNGDGQGTEVQLRSLPIELGGELERDESGGKRFKPDEDGYRAGITPLGLQAAPPAAPTNASP